MSYNLKSIKRDLQGSPIPQFFNPTADDFQPLTGVALGGGRYASDVLGWGKTAGGLYVPLKVADDGTLLTQLTGSEMELYSDTISDRPSANSVAKGTTFTLINANFDTWISDGVEWKEV